MPSFSFLEEFSVIRAKYKTAFSDLMEAAARTTGTDVSLLKNHLIKAHVLSSLIRHSCTVSVKEPNDLLRKKQIGYSVSMSQSLQVCLSCM